MYRNDEHREFARKLRNLSTAPERALWRALRGQQLRGFKFRRQAAIGDYVVDFVCFSRKLVIELDGAQHAEGDAPKYDEERTAWLASRGFRVFRFWNHELDDGLTLVVDRIRGALEEPSTSVGRPPSLALPAEGRGPEDRVSS